MFASPLSYDPLLNRLPILVYAMALEIWNKLKEEFKWDIACKEKKNISN